MSTKADAIRRTQIWKDVPDDVLELAVTHCEEYELDDEPYAFEHAVARAIIAERKRHAKPYMSGEIIARRAVEGLDRLSQSVRAQIPNYTECGPIHCLGCGNQITSGYVPWCDDAGCQAEKVKAYRRIDCDWEPRFHPDHAEGD